jgi:hypothetical protein
MLASPWGLIGPIVGRATDRASEAMVDRRRGHEDSNGSRTGWQVCDYRPLPVVPKRLLGRR